MHDFEKLKIWQKAMDSAVHVGSDTIFLSNNKKFKLIYQIKKCTISIPSNIVKRAIRNGKKEFVQFLRIANGSTFELITQLIHAKRLHLIKEDSIQLTVNQLVEV